MCAVYMCMCISVFMGMCVYRHTYTCLCMSVNIKGQHEVAFRCHLPCFLKQSLEVAWGSPVKLGWLVSEPQAGICPSLSPLLVLGKGYYISLFYSGIKFSLPTKYRLPGLYRANPHWIPTVCQEIVVNTGKKKNPITSNVPAYIGRQTLGWIHKKMFNLKAIQCSEEKRTE